MARNSRKAKTCYGWLCCVSTVVLWNTNQMLYDVQWMCTELLQLILLGCWGNLVLYAMCMMVGCQQPVNPRVCVCSSTNKINQTSVFSTILEDDILYYARQLWSSYYTLNTYGVDRYRYDNLSTSLCPETNCNKAAALRLYRRRLRLRHDTSQMYHNNTQQQWALNSIAMRR